MKINLSRFGAAMAATLISTCLAIHAQANEFQGQCGPYIFKLSYSYNPDVDEIGNPWKAMLVVDKNRYKGCFIAGGDGFSFYTPDEKKTLSARPSGYILTIDGKEYKCKATRI